MAMRPSAAASDEILDGGLDAYDGGTLTIFDGTQPSAGGGSHSDNQLAQIALPTPAFAAASARSRAPTGSWQDTVDASGTAGWARMDKAGGGAPIDFAVGEGSGDISLDETDLVAGGTVSVTGGTITLPGNDA